MNSNNNSFVQVKQGVGPVVLGFPHGGTKIPPDVQSQLNENGKLLADTDWNISQVFEGVLADVTSLHTAIHRYVIDVNRDPDGISLYPGQNTTSLCPTTDFDGESIYQYGREPDELEISRRCVKYHQPYHDALKRELLRVKEENGFAILLDCHSIRSKIAFLFDGKLPDFNIGTNNGSSCSGEVEQGIMTICANADGYTSVLNGRFKGGWTTRHYADPIDGIHTIQIELAQSTYMDEFAPWTYRNAKANELRKHLNKILIFLSNWRPQ